jgi:hypothetical protein
MNWNEQHTYLHIILSFIFPLVSLLFFANVLIFLSHDFWSHNFFGLIIVLVS